MRGRRRARLAVLTCAVMIGVGALAGCGGDDGGPVSLKWFIAIQPGGSIQKVAEDCSKASGGKYDIDLELLPTDASQQREQLVRRLGAEDSSIDLIGMDVVWTAEFANAGWIRKWAPADRKEVSRGVFKPVLETASYEGDLYGAPFNSNTQLLWYRKDLVPKPPKTWDEMVRMAEKLGPDNGGQIQLQSNKYEGFTVWANAMIESAGTQILSGPETVDLTQGPTEKALASMGLMANSPAAAPNLTTSDEDTSRLGFEAGAAFMVNYTFAYGSARENAPDVAKNMGAARYPGIVPGRESKPPLGGFNLGVSTYSKHADLAFDAAKCLTEPRQQLTVTELDGLAPARSGLYDTKAVKKAFPGFANLVRESIETAGPRPVTPAYQDVSLGIQDALHPPTKIDPDDPGPAYDELKDKVQQGVDREGLL
ncbi:MAG: extracellular solute-binding protein [Solirubrobacterales bacterium]|nr:extracellular solute-binding protein [Solirubrobacterales bacterium]MCB8915823.1 extracellular solute-binding protein [Thermoleophilales bacterium]